MRVFRGVSASPAACSSQISASLAGPPPHGGSRPAIVWRIPIPNARFVYRWIRIGGGIDVYYRGRRPPAHQRINPHPGP